MSRLRVAFAGTPAFARVALDAIVAAAHDVPLALTQPDRPAGRGMKLQASPVKQLAQDLGVPVVQPRGLRLDGRFPDDARAARDALTAARLDVMVVAAYGLILPRWVLDLPRLGCLNIHASLLPRWRGAAPIQRAIEAGDPSSGITIMQMDEGLDTGDIRLVEAIDVTPADTAATLHDRLAALGARLVVQALAQLAAGTLPRRPQPAEGVTYAHKLDKAEAAIDWGADAAQIERRARAFDPVPALHFDCAGETVKVWRVAPRADTPPAPPGTVLASEGGRLTVACGRGAIDLVELQRPGGRRIDARTFLQARPLQPGTRIG